MKKYNLLIAFYLLSFNILNLHSQNDFYNISKGAVIIKGGDTIKGLIRIDRGLTTQKFVTFYDNKKNKKVYTPSELKEFYYFNSDIQQPIIYLSDINPTNNHKEFFRSYGYQPVILYRITKSFGFSYSYIYVIKKDGRFLLPPCKSMRLYSYLSNSLPECPKALENINKSDLGDFDKEEVMRIYDEYYR